MYKSPTTPDDPVLGVLEVLTLAAKERGVDREALLRGCELLVHATTWATNAVLTGGTSRTAFLTTEGHPDVLLLREGGRIDPFDNTVSFPQPLVPRSLTFEVPERILADGTVHKSLDEAAAIALIDRIRERDIDAVGVCLLWSIVNPVHEQRLGELLQRHLPEVPFTLSHRLNPSMRECRRASSTCIDASLKPVMTSYLNGLEERLSQAGFEGRLLSVTSQGGVVDAADLATAPIINQGIDPREAILVGGGGAAGLNAVQIARRLGCPQVIIPAVAATLSAAGALMSDLSREFSRTCFTTSKAFDFEAVNATLTDLAGKCRRFLEGRATGDLEQSIEFSVEGRYPHQKSGRSKCPWRNPASTAPGTSRDLEEDLHALHEEMFAIADRRSHVEAVTWRARARCVLPRRDAQVIDSADDGPDRSSRRAYFGDIGSVDIVAEHFESMKIGEPITGPAIVESGFTTVVVDTGATVERTATGNLNITPRAEACPKTRATVPAPIDERAAMSTRGKAANGVERSYDGVRLAVLSKRFESEEGALIFPAVKVQHNYSGRQGHHSHVRDAHSSTGAAARRLSRHARVCPHR